MNVLVIEDSEAVVRSMEISLKVAWPECKLVSAQTGEQGIELVETKSPDIVILDLGLPDMDGLEVLKEIRRFSEVPVIIVTVREGEMDKAACLEGGADDYIVKPFSPLDLISRMRAVLRRTGRSNPEGEDIPTLAVGGLIINFSAREVLVNGQRVHLTPTEWKFLFQLARNPGRIVTLQAFKQRVWCDEYIGTSTIKKYIYQLRTKLGDTSHPPRMILSEHGTGYKFVTPK